MHRGKIMAAAACAAVVLLLLLWGSGSGTPVLSAPSGEAGVPERRPPVITTAGDQVPTTTASELGPPVSSIDWLMVFFALVVLAIAVKFIQWLLNRDWEKSQAPAEDELSDDLDLLLQATSDGARTRALAEGEPRNVVVRCWVALEDAAASSGLARDPAETAAEFTQRFLGVWDVNEALTQELAELYREARFSRHPVTRETGDRAVGVVSSIHDQLRASDRHRADADASADEHADADLGDGR